MLPQYNKPKGMSDVIAEKMSNLHEVNESMKEDHEPAMDEFETVAAEILLAIDKKDPKMLVKGLHALWSMYDASPHVEGENEEEKGPGALLITGQI